MKKIILRLILLLVITFALGTSMTAVVVANEEEYKPIETVYYTTEQDWQNGVSNA